MPSLEQTMHLHIILCVLQSELTFVACGVFGEVYLHALYHKLGWRIGFPVGSANTQHACGEQESAKRATGGHRGEQVVVNGRSDLALR